jgi:hypothetical protein
MSVVATLSRQAETVFALCAVEWKEFFVFARDRETFLGKKKALTFSRFLLTFF